MVVRQLLVLCLVGCSMLAVAQGAGKEFDYEEGMFTDARDGKQYQTITFEIELKAGISVERTWLAENLNFNVPGSYCYDDEPAYCSRFGRLYNYEAAKEACPEGWHVPTIKEWNTLFKLFGGVHEAGTHLTPDGDSHMNMLYGGFAEPGHVFKDITISGNWWDSEAKGNDTAGIITLGKGTGEIAHQVIGNYHRLSSRCVKFHN
ncbi:MAG: FISUMP domain-containing protein [Bacteroidota bacterium]